MEKDEFTVATEKLQGEIVSEVVVTDAAVVVKFVDNTYLDIYQDPTKQSLKASTNKL